MNNNQRLTKTEEIEKLNNISQILADFIAPLEQNNSRPPRIGFTQALRIVIKFLGDMVSSVLREAGYWEKISFMGLGVSLMLLFGFALVINTIKYINPKLDSKLVVLLAIICIFLVILLLLVFIVLNIRRTLTSPSSYTRVKFSRAISEAIDDRAIIRQLCERADKQTLKFAEIQTKYLIEDIQVQEKTNSNLLPLLALGSVVLSIYLLSIPTQSL